MASSMHLEPGRLGGHFLARISLGVPRPSNPMLPFEPRMIATPIGDHPIVGIYDGQIRARLLTIFAEADWSHITVARIGFPGQGPSQCPATILVAVRPTTLSPDKAAEMIRSAADFIYGFAELADVAIEIIEANVVPHYDSPDTGSIISHSGDTVPHLSYRFEDAFCDTPSIGVGIGLSGSNSTGTLGGYLTTSASTRPKSPSTQH